MNSTKTLPENEINSPVTITILLRTRRYYRDEDGIQQPGTYTIGQLSFGHKRRVPTASVSSAHSLFLASSLLSLPVTAMTRRDLGNLAQRVDLVETADSEPV